VRAVGGKVDVGGSLRDIEDREDPFQACDVLCVYARAVVLLIQPLQTPMAKPPNHASL
jgi:hypothetical protein